MRNSFDIIPNQTLKGLSYRFPSIPSLQPNTIIKLSQSKNFIYIRYNPPSTQSSSSNTNPNRIQLPSKLCQFNNINQGPVQIEPTFNIKQCRKLAIYVNKLDWQIINNKVQMLEQQFMNQVQIVWPGAYLPVFYDVNNFVKLRVQCQGIGLLVQNSELEILVDDKNQHKQQHKQTLYKTDVLKILPISMSPSGNINKIFMTKQHQFYRKQLQKYKNKILAQKHKQKQPTNSNKNIDQNQNSTTSITTSQINQQYKIQLKYQVDNLQQNKTFPCDTTQLSIKKQIQIIKSPNNIKPTENKNKNKYQSLLVEVFVIDDCLEIQEKCQKQTGGSLQTVYYTQCKNKQQLQSSQQSNQQLQQQSQKLKKKQPQMPKYQAYTPPQPPSQSSNIILLSEALIKNWNINPKIQIFLQIMPTINQTVSKKLQYLMNLNGFNIDVVIAQKNQGNSQMQNIKSNIVDSVISNLCSGQQNGITIYSKIPYLFAIDKNSKVYKFAYISIKQNNNQIADPITINYNNNSSTNKNKKQQKIQLNAQIQKQQNQSMLIKKQSNNNKNNNNNHNNNNNNIKQKLLTSTKIQNYFYADQNDDNIKIKTGLLWKLNCAFQKVDKKINYDQKDQLAILKKMGKSNQEIFMQLYKICYADQIARVIGFVRNKSNYAQAQPLPLLITSFANNGKTIMNKILKQNGYKTLYIDMSQMDDTSLNIADLSLYLQLIFQIYENQLIFMDNLDSVCYKIDNGDVHRQQEKIAAKLIIRQIIKYSKMYKKLCIFTAKNQANIDQELVHYQLVKLKNPIRQLREKVLKEFSSKVAKTKAKSNNKVDLKQIYSKQKIDLIIQNSESMSFGQFSKYIISGHCEEKNVDAGGLDFKKLAGIKDAKNMLRTVVERPLKYSFVFKKLPIKLSRGVLLYGGSGTGKSAVGQALAGEFKMKFFSVKGSDILSKYIGGSQAAVRDIFQKAMSVSPSIVFFDEFQSIVPRRNSSNTGVTDRVVNQFLCYLDGVASVQGVYIIAASSRPELIDPALLRPGRIDTHIFLDYPTRQQRQELFSLYSNSITFQSTKQQLLDITQNFSYSDLIGLIKQLRIKKSAKILGASSKQIGVEINTKQFKYIESQFLRQTIKTYKIPMSKQQKMKQRQKYLKFKRGDAPDISKQKTMLQ